MRETSSNMSHETALQNNSNKKLLRDRLKRKIQSISCAKRQRCVVRRTHSPKNAPFVFPPTSLVKELPEGNSDRSNVQVPLLPPTVEGILEAAKSTIIAFPSETVYHVGCRVNDMEAIRTCEYLLLHTALQNLSNLSF